MSKFIYSLLNNFLYAIAWVFAKIASLLSSLVFWAAEFSDFTTLEQVSKAWVIVRDFSNMFFILILLVIAFGTVINKEEYSYKKLLGKMIIAAILVNFSKTICGLIIDASQIFLFTFLKATYQVKEAGLLEAFGLHDLLSAPEGTEPVFTDENVFFSLIVVVVLLAAACTVMLTYAVMFLIRVAMLWLLVVTSPLPYVLNILPISQIQEFANKWWKMFGNYVVLGPMIGFFLWLALFIATYKGDTVTTSMADSSDLETPETSSDALTKAASPELIANFVIATLLLLGGLQMTTGLASEFSEITGRTTSLGKNIVKFTGRRLDDAQNLVRKTAGWLIGKTGQGMGVAAGRFGVGKVSGGFHFASQALGAVGRTVGADFSLRPSEIGKAFKEVTSAWDEQKMHGRRANLKQAMAGAMTPSRWVGNVVKKTLAGQAVREKGNAKTVEGALNNLGNNQIQDIVERHRSGQIDDEARDQEIQEVINGLNIGENRDQMRQQINQAMAVLQERMQSNDYGGGERERMQDAQADLGTLDGFLRLDNVAAAGTDISNFLTKQNEGATKAMNNFESFGAKAREKTDLGKIAYGVGDWVASKYAGEDDFATSYHQTQIAEAKKKLELQTGGITEQVVNKLENAYKRGDTADIVAGLEQLWNANDPNEMHNSNFLMELGRKEVVRRAKAKAVVEGRDVQKAAKTAASDFDQNYTSQQYMGVLVQKILERAYKGNKKAMAKQAQRLDNISVLASGCSHFASAVIDAETGEGRFNDGEIVFDKKGNAKMRISRSQIAAILAKRKNTNIGERLSKTHPMLMTARDINGRQRGLTDAGREIIDISVAEEFMNPKSWRPDLVEDLNTKESLQDIIAMVQEAANNGDAILQQKRSAFMVTIAGMDQGAFSDKDAGKFFKYFTSGNNKVEVGDLQALLTGNKAQRKAIIEALMQVAGVGAIGAKKAGGGGD